MVLEPRSLPQATQRRFVQPHADLGDWSQAAKYFTELETRPIGSTAELESWLLDYSELLAVVSEAGSVRFIRMTEQTDNQEYKEAHLSFVENVVPKVKVAEFNLNRKFAGSRFAMALAPEKYHMVRKRVDNSIALFREENVELEKEDALLGHQYEATTGAMTVLFESKERTMSEMLRFLEDQDRPKREDAWRLTQGRRMKDGSKLDKVFDEMVHVRDRVARNSGFDNFRDFSFLNRGRFDYGPADCEAFHAAVERHIVPLNREIQEGRRQTMGLDALRPWDLAVDAEGRPPLRPFETAEDLVRKGRDTLARVHPVFGDNFQKMVDLDLFDLSSRPGKAPGGYNAELSDHMLPFTFMNSVGRDQDMWTLLHESGHAFHVFEMREKKLPYHNRGESLPSEIAEVASMSMELMSFPHIDGTFYDTQDANRSIKDHLKSIIALLPWIATIDAFQHWVYTHPLSSAEERKDAWVRTDSRFGGGESWDGLEEIRRHQWHRQLHVFLMPFYYIEYGIAQIGALGMWSRYKNDPRDAIEAYRNALSLGSSRSLPELFGAAGLPWDFGDAIIRKYADELRKLVQV